MPIALSRLPEGSSGTVTEIHLGGAILRRTQELGLTEGCQVHCVMRGAGQGPIAVKLRGAVIALRRQDAARILVEGTWTDG